MAYTNSRGIPLKNKNGIFVPGALSGAGADMGMPWLDNFADGLKNAAGGGGGGSGMTQAQKDELAKKQAEEDAKKSQIIPGVPNMYLAGAGVVAAALLFMNKGK